jgi:hypothetical protein
MNQSSTPYMFTVDAAARNRQADARTLNILRYSA